MALTKKKLSQDESASQKIKLLTLVPSHSTYHEIREEFGVTDYMIKQAKLLLKEKGLLGEKTAYCIPESARHKVKILSE